MLIFLRIPRQSSIKINGLHKNHTFSPRPSARRKIVHRLRLSILCVFAPWRDISFFAATRGVPAATDQTLMTDNGRIPRVRVDSMFDVVIQLTAENAGRRKRVAGVAILRRSGRYRVPCEGDSPTYYYATQIAIWEWQIAKNTPLIPGIRIIPSRNCISFQILRGLLYKPRANSAANPASRPLRAGRDAACAPCSPVH
jgi:hypothetical protein